MITFSRLGQMGRLGNTLFQCSATIGIAKTLGLDYAFPKWEYQDYFEKSLPYIDLNHKNTMTIPELSFQYTPIIEPTYQGVIYDINGYRQSPLYWQGHEDEVKSYFKLTQTAFHKVCENWSNIVTQIPPYGKLETVGLHVRRCDYIEAAAHHTDLSKTRYYDLALTKMQNLLGHEKLNVIVFSDDIDFCKDYFKNHERFYYAPTTDPVLDLFTLALCDHHIIANSSFSWWAAYLSGNEAGHIISPGFLIKWFGPAYPQHEFNTQDLIPHNWIQI